MTVKVLEKKVAILEKTVVDLERRLSVVAPKRKKIGAKRHAELLRSSAGVISKKRGAEIMRAIEKGRNEW